MKAVKTILVLICVMVVGIGVISVNVQAAEEGAKPMGKMLGAIKSNHFDKDWGGTLGVKAWVNEWDMPFEFPLSDTASTTLEFESGTEATYIPTFIVRYRNFFIGGSYLPETDYQFSAQEEYIPFIIQNREVANVRFDPHGKRKEWDLNIGYFITPNLAVSLGYKHLERDLKVDIGFPNQFGGKSTPIDYPLSAHAQIIGLSAALPVGRGFSLYNNMAFGWLTGDSNYKSSFDNSSINYDLNGNYALGELGLGYVILLDHKIATAVTIIAGYRFQRLDYKAKNASLPIVGSSGDQHDSTAGFVLGVNTSL